MPRRSPKTMTAPELVERALELSGHSTLVDFAEHELGRDESTVRRWLRGSTLPDVTRRWLERYVERRTPRAR